MYQKNYLIESCIDQINKEYFDLLKNIFKPIIGIYFGLILKDIIINNYYLKKEVNFDNISQINEAPDNICSNNYSIQKIDEKKYLESLKIFTKTIENSFSKEYLGLFYHNKENIEIHTIDYKKSNLLNGEKVKGEYDASINVIKVQLEDYLNSINHELFHMSSSYSDGRKGVVYLGLMQREIEKRAIGCALNEGYTQLLTERYFPNTDGSNTYVFEKKIAHLFEVIVGKELMEKYYLTANLNELIAGLSSYANKDEIIDFINNFDLVAYNIGSYNSLILSNRKLIKDKLFDMNSFLLKVYFEKNDIKTFEDLDEINLLFYERINDELAVNGKVVNDLIKYDFENKLVLRKK